MAAPDVDAMLAAFRTDLAAATTPEALEEVRRAHTGKKAPLKLALRGLKDVDPAERPAVAQALNQAQQAVETELAEAKARVEAEALEARLAAEWQDLTLPGVAVRRGMRHPVAQVEAICVAAMRRLGFDVVEGPEVETPFYNFDALNIPEHHPARDMQDTFWLDGGLLLRSHTTTVQARTLEARPPLPIKVVSLGRVYRNEAVDATHLAMFHQFEGICVDEGLTFAHLKGTLSFVARALFGEDRQ
ncbi:MAG: phenylalanine--tRNA ligase subunit alpha, partial [Myxococcales bacterium]|nr:phenylalanine--tRNA ligase subunit alpha [Myxococcales bacterium]